MKWIREIIIDQVRSKSIIIENKSKQFSVSLTFAETIQLTPFAFCLADNCILINLMRELNKKKTENEHERQRKLEIE